MREKVCAPHVEKLDHACFSEYIDIQNTSELPNGIKHAMDVKLNF